MFHPQILLDELHSGRLLIILVCVIVVTVQAVHDVTFKVIKKVHLLCELFGNIFRAMVLANVYSSVSPWSNIIKMAIMLSEKAREH